MVDFFGGPIAIMDAMFRPSSIFLVLLLPALTGCGRPDIRIDVSELEQSSFRSQPVGLLEIKEANRGNGFGMHLGETQGESEFCTGTVLQDGSLLTSSDCMRSETVEADPKNMLFHLQLPGAPAQVIGVQKIASVDAEKGIAILVLKTSADTGTFGSSLSMQTAVPAKEELEANLNTMTITIPGPDRNGVAKVLVSTTKAMTSYSSTKVIWEDDEKDEDEGEPEESEKKNTDLAAPEVEPIRDLSEVYSKPQPLLVSGIRGESKGAPIFYNGKIVGLTKGGGRYGKNAQWLLKR